MTRASHIIWDKNDKFWYNVSLKKLNQLETVENYSDCFKPNSKGIFLPNSVKHILSLPVCFENDTRSSVISYIGTNNTNLIRKNIEYMVSSARKIANSNGVDYFSLGFNNDSVELTDFRRNNFEKFAILNLYIKE